MSWREWIPILEEVVESEVEKAPSASPVHKLDHLRRVWGRCKILGGKLGADLEVLVAAAYLHDLGRHHMRGEHGVKSAELAGPILDSIGFPAEKRRHVLDAIGSHQTRVSPEERKTLEARVLYDSDKLDVFGAVGVSRFVLRYFAGKSLGEVDIDALAEKVGAKWRGLNFEESRKMGEEDYRYVRDYFRKLKEELSSGA